MKQRLKFLAKLGFNLLAFGASAWAIGLVAWTVAGKPYLYSLSPMGGDYFNALTYANFFKDHLVLPPQGWIPFWNEGTPVVGGYPWLTFYFISLLTRFYDVASAMDLFSVITLGLFFIFSLGLFWQVSKNWFLAVGLTLVLIFTRSTYYPLTTGAFISSASAMFYLPLVLWLIYQFKSSNSNRILVLAGVAEGLSLLHHGPTNLIMTFLPAVVVLMTLRLRPKHWTRGISEVAVFGLVSALIGSMGIYTVALQMFSGSGTDSCVSPQCWGIYPQHLETWMNWVAPVLVGGALVLALLVKLFRRKTALTSLLPGLAGLAVFIIYGAAAYYHLINGLANVIFPTRTFWAINLFLLLITASLFGAVQRSLLKISWGLSVLILLGLSYYFYSTPFTFHRDYIAVVPSDIYAYVVPKYQSHKLTELVPEWVPLNETNWRFDTFNAGLTQWWNFAATTPSTKGYSNHPIGVHKDWQYLLTVGTREGAKPNPDTDNRALFLMDAYGIGFHENSVDSYPKSILNNPELIQKTETKRDFSWYQLSSKHFSPVVYPTASNPVLFIGDSAGYSDFIRALAMVNLNSLDLVPVRGESADISKYSLKELSGFKAIVASRFKGSNWANIREYVKLGGSAYIDTGSIETNPDPVDELLPIKSLATVRTKGEWQATLSPDSRLVNQLNIKDFSDLAYQGTDWKLSTAPKDGLKTGATGLIGQENNWLLVSGKYGQGQVIWSGINLIYHIVNNDNFTEAKLWGNILGQLSPKAEKTATFEVKRPMPEQILITGQGFKGVYFKESFDSGWKAMLNNRELKIYPAGLEFMYAPIPAELGSGPLNVTFSYRGNLLSWSLFYMTIISILVAVFYIVYPRPLEAFGRVTRNGFDRLTKRFQTWFDKEE